MPRRKKTWSPKTFGRRIRACSMSAPAVLCKTSSRPAKRKTWTDEQMKGALQAVQEGQSVRQVARYYGVPRLTLRDRVFGHVVHGVNPGPKPYLSSNEEKELEAFLKNCAQVGYSKTTRDVMSIAESVANDKGVSRGTKISEGWWRRFLECQPKLTLRRGDPTAHVRMDAINEDTLDQYFSLLKDVMEEHSLYDKPSQIYNIDESGVPLDREPLHGSEESGEPAAKMPRREVPPTNSADSEVDENVCCMCFGSYYDDVLDQSGRDWINCACSQWLHGEWG